MDTTLDPLRNSELHRALAFARARETYPGIPGDLLLELCDAAWERSAGDTRDGAALTRFERALDVVARSYRVGGGRLSVSEVARDAIPMTALQPYIDAQKRRPAAVEPAPEPVAAAPPRRSLSDKLSRLPKLAPAPLGVSLAAGVFGVAAAAQAGVLEQTPLAPLSFTGKSDSPAPADRDSSGSAARADRSADSGRAGTRSHGGTSPLVAWVGERAAGHAAGNAEPGPRAGGASDRAAEGDGQVAGDDFDVSNAPLDLAGSTGAAPAPALVPAATPVPAAPAAPAPPAARRTPAIPQMPAVQVDLGDDQQTEEESNRRPKANERERVPVGVHYPAADDAGGRGPVIQLPGGVTVQLGQNDPDGEKKDANGGEQLGLAPSEEHAPVAKAPEGHAPPQGAEDQAPHAAAPEQQPARATSPPTQRPAATPPAPAAAPAAPAQPPAPAPPAPAPAQPPAPAAAPPAPAQPPA